MANELLEKQILKPFGVYYSYLGLNHILQLLSLLVGVSVGTVACLYVRSFCSTFHATVTMYHVSTSSESTSPSMKPPPAALSLSFELEKGNTSLVHNMSDNELLARASTIVLQEMKGGVPSSTRLVPKLAFLFLTKGPLPFSPLWERFFKGHHGLYSIYVHPHPSHVDSWPRISVFYGRRIRSQPVAWGSSTMVDAERRLLASALLDPSNKRFILLSESCIPLFDFTTTYRYLLNSNLSFLSSYDDPRRAGRGRYNRKMWPAINVTQWRKGSQWFELNRDLASKVISDRKYYKVFNDHCGRLCYMDEHYIPTLVNMLWPDRSWNRSITWVDWSRGGSHPRRFDHHQLHSMAEEDDHHHSSAEEQMQELRLKATELLVREEWRDCIQVYTQFLTLCKSHLHNNPDESPQKTAKIHRSICLALSNRAEARFRLKDSDEALLDCDQALAIEPSHFKSLLCKGRILLALNRYSSALNSFKSAVIIQDPQWNGYLEILNGYIEKCRKLESLSRTGALDLSDWVLNGFRGNQPELAEYVGNVRIDRSDLSGRGLFATKNMDSGTLVLVTKAVATERCILSDEDSAEDAQLVMWKRFVDQVAQSASKCDRIRRLISTLSTGEDESSLEIPKTELFRTEEPETEECCGEIGSEKLLSILDVNSLVEDSISAKVLGKNSDYYGVGLWVMASFINHSCNPNSRRIHVGDYVLIHLSRDVKAGEELTSAYFDVLSPLSKRKEMSLTWGFQCRCKRCKFEEETKLELDIELDFDIGGTIVRVEEATTKRKEKGYLRASYWGVYEGGYDDREVRRRWGRRIPAAEAVVESVAEAVGSDERLVKVLREELKRKRSGGKLEMEKALLVKIGRGVYGKVVKKQALRSLIGIQEQKNKLLNR
ncbi:Glycosyltransferase BC10 [Linum grandiflorum]